MEESIYASSQQVFEGSADTQLFLDSGKPDQSYVISFSGFLNTTTDDLEGYRATELIFYRGETAKNLLRTMKKRAEEGVVNEHHSFRRFPMTRELKEKIVEWMFKADVLDFL